MCNFMDNAQTQKIKQLLANIAALAAYVVKSRETKKQKNKKKKIDYVNTRKTMAAFN